VGCFDVIDMIQKLQRVFHTDKWWGSLFLFASFYILYFMLGYWIWFLFAKLNFINSDIFIDKLISAISFLFLLPILSFFLTFKIRKNLNLNINKIILFFINLILILLNLFLFILAGIYSFVSPNFF